MSAAATMVADIQRQLAAKDAENARLQSEIGRLRRQLTATSSTIAQDAADEVQLLQTQLDSVLAQNRTLQRREVLAQAVPSSSTSEADVHRLTSEVEAREAFITKLQAELTSQAQSHAIRLSEMQDSFLAKIAELRKVHEQQLTEKQTAADTSIAEAQAHVTRLQADLQATNRQSQDIQEQAKHQADQHASQLRKLQEQLDAASRQCQTLQTRLDEVQGAHRQLDSSTAIGSSASMEIQSTIRTAQPCAAATSPPSPDDALIELMEQQLRRLSDVIKSREAEILQLKSTVQTGCEERRQLLHRLQSLESASTAAATRTPSSQTPQQVVRKQSSSTNNRR